MMTESSLAFFPTSLHRSRRKCSPKQHARFCPVALNCPCSYAKCDRGFFFTQPAEKATLHYLRQAWFHERELLHCVVDLEKNLWLRFICDILVVECDADRNTFAFASQSRSRAVHEDMSHGNRSERKKMRLVTPCYARLLYQLQVGFVNEASGVQRPPVTRGKLASRNAAKVIVDVRYQ